MSLTYKRKKPREANYNPYVLVTSGKLEVAWYGDNAGDREWLVVFYLGLGSYDDRDGPWNEAERFEMKGSEAAVRERIEAHFDKVLSGAKLRRMK